MEPGVSRFGGGVTATVLYPVVAIALLIAIILILFLPRKYVIVPLLLATFVIPVTGQVVVVGGVHFTALRILVLFGCVRLMLSRFSSPKGAWLGGFNPIDQAVTLCVLFDTLSCLLLWMEWPAVINRLGTLLDALGGYFVLRFLIRDQEDLRRAIKVFAVIATVMAISMIREQVTRQNLFWQGTLMGTSTVRDGSIRSQGAFQVYLMAGAFGATLLPLVVWLWKDGRSRIVAATGVISSAVMTWTSGSSTPIGTYAAGLLALCFWPFRKQMRFLRWGLAITLVGLHLVMKAPVWHLIGRVDLTGSSTSYHRFMLVDSCIRHFSDWWLIGTKNNANWGWEMWDTSNQYVSYAVSGGLATLVMFILIIARSFGRIGAARKLAQGDFKQEWLLWCLGAALFAHVVGYFGVGYDSQMQMAWFALLALISVATSEAMRPAAVHLQNPGESQLASSSLIHA